MKHTLDHLKMLLNWEIRAEWLKALVWVLHMAFCFVLGHYSSGTPAYLSGIEKQMVAMHLQRLSMSSSVDCKSCKEDSKHAYFEKLVMNLSPDRSKITIFVVLLVRLLQILPPLLKVEQLLQT